MSSTNYAQIDTPSYTYQCMLTQLSWKGGTPPYTVWLSPSVFGDQTDGYGIWPNMTETSFTAPCIAPAGSEVHIVMKDAEGLISTGLNFLVLPSTDSSCLNREYNAAGLSKSQSLLSSSLQDFRESVNSVISVSATMSRSTTVSQITSTNTNGLTVATIQATPPSTHNSSVARIVGPVVGALGALLVCIVTGIWLVRKRRRRKLKASVQLGSASGFDIAGGEEARIGHVGGMDSGPQQELEMREVVEEREAPIIPRPQPTLRLHNGSLAGPSTVKGQQSAVPNLPTNDTIPVPSSPLAPATSNRAHTELEQRAEQLSGHELEQLAALVERRLDRVRGAPPQYQATEGIGV